MSRHTDYSPLDKAIIDAIGRGITRYDDMERDPHVAAIASRVRSMSSNSGESYLTPVFRTLQRRLQTLRALGRIRHSKERGWEIIDNTPRLPESPSPSPGLERCAA